MVYNYLKIDSFNTKLNIFSVEFMVNLAADEFSEWCNSLASDNDSKTITRDLIKQLFAIETEGSAPKGVQVQP